MSINELCWTELSARVSGVANGVANRRPPRPGHDEIPTGDDAEASEAMRSANISIPVDPAKGGPAAPSEAEISRRLQALRAAYPRKRRGSSSKRGRAIRMYPSPS